MKIEYKKYLAENHDLVKYTQADFQLKEAIENCFRKERWSKYTQKLKLAVFDDKDQRNEKIAKLQKFRYNKLLLLGRNRLFSNLQIFNLKMVLKVENILNGCHVEMAFERHFKNKYENIMTSILQEFRMPEEQTGFDLDKNGKSVTLLTHMQLPFAEQIMD